MPLPVDAAAPSSAPCRDPDAFWWATGIEDTFITAPVARHGPYSRRICADRPLRALGGGHRADSRTGCGGRSLRHAVASRSAGDAESWDWSFADKALGRAARTAASSRSSTLFITACRPGSTAPISTPTIPNSWPNMPAARGAFSGRFLVFHAAQRAAHHGVVLWHGSAGGRLIGAAGRVSSPLCWRLRAASCDHPSVSKQSIPTIVRRSRRCDRPLSKPPIRASRTRRPRRQEIVFLALDLVSGRVNRHHPLWSWLLGIWCRTERRSRLAAANMRSICRSSA